MKGGELDGRSDLYSLGVVAYQMLTGDLPLKADSTLELLMAHISTPPKPIHEARPDLNIPDSVAAVVMRCLEKNRELRPATGQALIDEVEAAAGRGPELPLLPANIPASITRKHVGPSAAVELPVSPIAARRRGAPYSRSGLWAVVAGLVAFALQGAWYLRDRKPPVAQNTPPVVGMGVETKPVETPGGETSYRATAQQPPASAPNDPTSGASQGPIRSIKREAAAPKPSKATSIAAGAKGAPIRTDDSAALGPTSAVPATLPAELEIHTNPTDFFSVYLDDKPLGVTDSGGRLHVIDISSGQHRLRLVGFFGGYRPYEATVDLVAGTNTKWFTLIPVISGGTNAASVQGGEGEDRITFEVLHLHPFGGAPANGRLTLSHGTLDFHEYGSHAHTTDDFRVACSEIKDANANTEPGQFHVRLQSKNYNFWAGSVGGITDKPRAVEILRDIASECALH